MPIPDTLLATLRCPESKQPLTHLAGDSEELSLLNGKIASGTVQDRGGNSITHSLDEALLREDGTLFFPFEDGFPVLLIERAMET